MNILLTFANTLARRTGFTQLARLISFVQILLVTWNTLARAGYVPTIRLRNLPNALRAARTKSKAQAAASIHRAQSPRPFRLDWRPAALLTFFALPLGLRADQKYRSMPQLRQPPGELLSITADPNPSAAALLSVNQPSSPVVRSSPVDQPSSSVVRPLSSPVSPPSSLLPSLSIIVPARNEAKNLGRLLPSLGALDYPGSLEIIVVDDQSTDQTGEIAARLGARVETVKSLPGGWHGKPNACHVGALAAQGDWLLFTDADTVHTRDSALRSVSFAHDHALDGLTLFLKQKPTTILDGAVLMSAFAGLFAGVSDSNTLMNGQYILLRRSVYLASDGFQAVRDQPLEDLALGNHLRKLGYTVVALNGETAATVRMYDSPAQMWHGMTRLGAGSLEWSGTSGLLTVLFTTALMSPLLVLVGVVTGSLRFAWLPVTWLAAGFSVLPFARRFGSIWLAALAPFGALFVLLAAMWGLVSRVLGIGVNWRGRDV